MSNTNHKISDSFLADGIILLLGMVMLTQFYTLYWTGAFIPRGFDTQITHFILPYWGEAGKAVIDSILPFKTFLAPALGVTMFLSAVCLTLLIGRKVVATLVGIGFFIFWVLTVSYPGAWTFEFFFPAIIAVSVGLLKLNEPNVSPSIYAQMGLSKTARLAIIVLLTAGLWYITSIAYFDKTLAAKIAASSAITFFILSLINFGLDSFLARNYQPKAKGTSEFRAAISSWPWIDIITLSIGAMMVMQVFCNYYSGLYIAKNAANLIKYYSSASADVWIRPFLAWSSAHMSWIIRPYAAFEICMAITLSLAIFRGPMLILSSVIFAVLGFSELGVSASWPPDNHYFTWEWELLLITLVGFWVGFARFIESFRSSSLREFILGRQIFNGAAMTYRLLIAGLGAAALYSIGIVTQVFGDRYKIISLSSGIVFLALLMILGLIDRYRGCVTEKNIVTTHRVNNYL